MKMAKIKCKKCEKTFESENPKEKHCERCKNANVPKMRKIVGITGATIVIGIGTLVKFLLRRKI